MGAKKLLALLLLLALPLSADQVVYSRFGNQPPLPLKFKDLTAASATNVFALNFPTGAWVGGKVFYTVVAGDGTDFQVRTGEVAFSGVNKAATETCNVYGVDGSFTSGPDQTQDGSSAGSMSSGTLTYTWAASTAPTNGCVWTLNAASSLTETTLRIYYYVQLVSPGTVIPQ